MIASWTDHDETETRGRPAVASPVSGRRSASWLDHDHETETRGRLPLSPKLRGRPSVSRLAELVLAGLFFLFCAWLVVCALIWAVRLP